MNEPCKIILSINNQCTVCSYVSYKILLRIDCPYYHSQNLHQRRDKSRQNIGKSPARQTTLRIQYRIRQSDGHELGEDNLADFIGANLIRAVEFCKIIIDNIINGYAGQAACQTVFPEYELVIITEPDNGEQKDNINIGVSQEMG